MTSVQNAVLRAIPSVDAVLRQAVSLPWGTALPQRVLAAAVRDVIQAWRERLAADPGGADTVDRESLADRILDDVRRQAAAARGPHYRRAINATGIILHTGLGRAVLPAAAIDRVREELGGYSVLQVDEQTGKRSRRDARIEWLLKQLTGCEAATVVNNNAAATMLVLNTLAAGREVIVSRGQLVEIGGSFRLPDVMSLSGARLVEVGTTNKTHARDYERAINENTGAILRVHPSNYHIEGFTAEVSLDELVAIAHARQLPLVDDVGAGALVDYRRFGLPAEPTLPDSIRGGADLVISSADKMIGGPQGGLILGRADLIEAIRKNPLARAMRVDKVTLSLLETTLELFLDEQAAMREVPTLRMMQRPLDELRCQATRIAEALRSVVGAAYVEVFDGFSQMGSGSLPGHDLPTSLVAVSPANGDVDGLAARLRACSPPVFARIAKERLLIDPRTLLPGEEEVLIGMLKSVLTH
jgi:L-seryl-tRNA(Ser) seleniumtransferase